MVFVRQEDKPQPGFNIAVLLNKKPIPGDIGLEIEVEGKKFPKPPGCAGSHTPIPMDDFGLKQWCYVHDGSLRGQDNAEYILAKPIAFGEVSEAVNKLFSLLEEKGAVIDESNRTSVHVHLNCMTFHFDRLTSFAALYFVLEEVLTEWCGEHRVGNLFCLRAKDAPGLVSQFKKYIQKDGRSPLRDHLHYSGLNLHSLTKHGSAEVRTLRGVSDPQVIIEWVGILQRLYDLSEDFRDPRDICDIFSAEGPLEFFNNLLGEKAAVVRNGIGWTDEQISQSMYSGIRIAQDICFCRDWDLFKALDIKADPFGRDAKKMAKKIMDAEDIAGGLAGFGNEEGEYYDEPAPVPIQWNPFNQ